MRTSQQVAALERQIEAQLLERGPGGLSLTEAGELLLRHADVVSARLELAAGQLGEIVAERGARPRVGAFPSALATVVPAAVARLTLEQPETRVDAIEGTQEELAAGVRDGGLHAAVCSRAPRSRAASTRERPARTCTRSRSRRCSRGGTGWRAPARSASPTSPATYGSPPRGRG